MKVEQKKDQLIAKSSDIIKTLYRGTLSTSSIGAHAPEAYEGEGDEKGVFPTIEEGRPLQSALGLRRLGLSLEGGQGDEGAKKPGTEHKSSPAAEILLKGEGDWPSFRERIEKTMSRLRLERNEEDLRMAQDLYREVRDDAAIAHTPTGLRLLLDVATPGRLRAYATVLSPDIEDFERVEKLAKTSPLAPYAFLMAFGAWAQNTMEKVGRLIDTPYAERRIAAEAFDRFGASESFWEGVLLSKRIWTAAAPTQKKRGRRPKAMTARHFASGDDAQTEGQAKFDVKLLLADIDREIKEEGAGDMAEAFPLRDEAKDQALSPKEGAEPGAEGPKNAAPSLGGEDPFRGDDLEGGGCDKALESEGEKAPKKRGRPKKIASSPKGQENEVHHKAEE